MNRELAEFVEDLQHVESANAVAKRLTMLGLNIGAGGVTTFFGSTRQEVFHTSLPHWWFEEYTESHVRRLHMIQAVRRGDAFVAWGSDLCHDNPERTPKGLERCNNQRHHFGLQTNISFPMADDNGMFRGGGVSFAFADSRDAFRLRMKRSRGALSVASFAAYSRIRALRHPQAPGGPLSARERDVLTGLAEGLHVSGIADRLMISDSAVNLYVANAKKKLGARTREQAVALALTNGWLQTD